MHPHINLQYIDNHCLIGEYFESPKDPSGNDVSPNTLYQVVKVYTQMSDMGQLEFAVMRKIGTSDLMKIVIHAYCRDTLPDEEFKTSWRRVRA